jgi:hypothetical protein
MTHITSCGRAVITAKLDATIYYCGFSANGWAGIVEDSLIRPSVLANRLGRIQHADFFGGALPLLLEYVPLNVREDI